MADGTNRDVLARGLRVLVGAVRGEPRLFAVAVGGSVLGGLVTVASAVVVGRVVGTIVGPALQRGTVDGGALAAGAAVIVALSLLKVVGIFCRRVGAGYLQFRLQARYRRLVTRRYLALPEVWHQRHATGALLSGASSDVDAIWYAMMPLPYAVGTTVMLLAAIIALLVIDLAIGSVAIAVFPALLTIYIVYSRRIAPRLERAQQVRSELSAVVHESFDGALVVKVLGREAEETARFAAKAAQLRDVATAIGKVRGRFDPLIDALPSAGTLVVLLVSAGRLRDGAVTLTELVTVVFLFSVLAYPVRAIGWLLAEVPRSVVGWDRVSAVLAATGDLVHGTRTLEPASGAPAALRLQSVSFAYEPGQPVLHEVSFSVPAGRTVALAGSTGAGKSTIAMLVARLADPLDPPAPAGSRRVARKDGRPTRRVKRGAPARPARAPERSAAVSSGGPVGSITLDGIDLRSLTADAMAAAVAVVPQAPFVFDDTVRANVTLDRPDIDDAAVWAALRQAQADGFVASLPDGLETALGERGATLSGGQRQRLTLARALAGRPRLLVLDDATSAVDPEVEAAIIAALRAGTGATTILVVAHRPGTLMIADEVVYLDGGRLVARGTHAALMASSPAYASLVTAYEREEARRTPTRPSDVELAPEPVGAA